MDETISSIRAFKPVETLMLIAGIIAGLMILSLFFSMLTQSPREEEEEPAVVESKQA
ncbi:MAG: hypothetical protein NTZ56_23745 [Acidobacteria bacterium]|nr:hypothetical protein [Acidobacteriota bacterium]